MFKILAFSLASAFVGAGATIQAVSASAVVTDNCRIHGYTRCVVINGVEMPSTSDLRLRAQLTLLVRQVSRDKL